MNYSNPLEHYEIEVWADNGSGRLHVALIRPDGSEAHTTNDNGHDSSEIYGTVRGWRVLGADFSPETLGRLEDLAERGLW
tara:strand:+ start:91 stop:330 length:240 start_codon:yes stop_codon:yes gene_type:complete